MNKMRNQFLLDPEVIFLNHGSFGATPVQVEYQNWQRLLEKQPVEFLGRRASELLRNARRELASYLGTDSQNLVFVTNATVGLNIVARGLDLRPGDEVLTSDHEYGALDRTWQFLAQQKRFRYINQPIPLLLSSQQAFVERFWQAVTRSTRVIFLSHITSPTALIFPIEEIIKKARQQNILTVIDGAHAPGQIDVSIDALDVDFYCGNLHKWLCAPKGAAFLYANPRVQHLVQPLVVSWGWQSELPGPSQFIDYLEWQGTRDLSAFLAVPAAIRFQQENNWPKIQSQCYDILKDICHKINQLTGLPPVSPPSQIWYRQMAACHLPTTVDIDHLKSSLYDRFHIEVPVLCWNQQPLIRISIQAYNSEKDTLALESALKQLL
jgi:isopenicillin-N epimerase